MSRGWTWTTLTTGLVVLLCAIRPAFSGEEVCKGLSTVKASKLVGVGPEVSCKREGPGPTPNICKNRGAITEDRMLGDARRLIVVGRSDRGRRYDSIRVFGCRSGQIKEVLDDSWELDAKVDYAAADKVVVISTPQDSDNKSPRKTAYLWDSEKQRYCPSGYKERNDECPDYNLPSGDTFFSYRNFPGHITSGSLKQMKAEALVPIDTYCWEGSIYEHKKCDSGLKIVYDEMITEDRRAVVVEGDAAARGNWVSFVFTCVSGRVRLPLADEGSKIESVSANKLILQGFDWSEGGALCCPNGLGTMTYIWDADLHNYTLTDISYSSHDED